MADVGGGTQRTPDCLAPIFVALGKLARPFEACHCLIRHVLEVLALREVYPRTRCEWVAGGDLGDCSFAKPFGSAIIPFAERQFALRHVEERI